MLISPKVRLIKDVNALNQALDLELLLLNPSPCFTTSRTAKPLQEDIIQFLIF